MLGEADVSQGPGSEMQGRGTERDKDTQHIGQEGRNRRKEG